MRKTASYSIGKSIRRMMLLIACGVFLGTAAYAQDGGGNTSSCTVTGLRLTISTADDDLRGGQDNLNIIVYFSGGGYQLAPNVNHGQNWPNNSTNTIAINLNRPVPPSEILGLRMVHIPDGGFNLSISPELATLAAPFAIAEAFQSPDNWNMGDIEIVAIGNGFGAEIGHHGFHRFTGSDPALSIPVQAPANICGSAKPSGGIGVLNPGSYGLRSVAGGSSKYGVLTNNDVIRMSKAGVPESAIIASIRNNQAKFDLSPSALAGLKQAGVNPNIQEVMRARSLGDGGKGTVAGTTDGGKRADDLSPQPYPPKGTLLTPAAQPTMLGGNPSSAGSGTTMLNGSTSAATKSALIPAVQRSATTNATPGDGSVRAGNTAGTSPGGTPALNGTGKVAVTNSTFTGGIRPNAAPQVGVSQTMSAAATSPTAGMAAPRTVATASATPRPISSVAAMGRVPSQVNLQVAAECAKDSTFRILNVSNASFTVGPQYTLWGCSFGTQANVKAPMPAGSASRYTTQSINREYAQIFVSAAGLKGAWFVKCDIQSWTDNAIVVALDAVSGAYPGAGPSPVGQDQPAELWLTRSDGQTTIWGHEGGFTFKPIN